MKTLQLSLAIKIGNLAIIASSGFGFALGQEMRPQQDSIQFIPEVPNEQSNVTAVIRVSTLDLYCVNYNTEHVLSDHELTFRITTKSNTAEKCSFPVLGDTFLIQNIGKLDFGAYDVKLIINETQKASTKLYVSQSTVEITSTGEYKDEEGNVHIVGAVKNTGTYPIKMILLDVNFVNDSQVMANNKLYTTIAALIPQASSGFDLLVDRRDLENMSYFVRTSSYQKDNDPIQQGLKMNIDSIWRINSGIGMISGTIFNYANTSASQIKIVCVFYDKSGNRALDSAFNYINQTIAQGQEGRFLISSHYEIPEFKVSCNAESPQLAILITSVPEFSIPVLSFVLSFGVIALLFKKFPYLVTKS